MHIQMILYRYFGDNTHEYRKSERRIDEQRQPR